MLVFVAVVIHFCDQVDFDRIDFDVNYLKSVVWNFIGLALILA